jgi:hypothetical protein
MGTQLAADVSKPSPSPPPNLTREDWETMKRIAAEAPLVFRAAASSGSLLALCLLVGKAQELEREAQLLVEKHPELDAMVSPAIEALGTVERIAQRRAHDSRSRFAQDRIESRSLVGDLVRRCRGTSREQRPVARHVRRTTRARSGPSRSTDDPSEHDLSRVAAPAGGQQ